MHACMACPLPTAQSPIPQSICSPSRLGPWSQVVYVVDAADPQRFEESCKALADVLSEAHLTDKPILVLANKQVEKGLDGSARLLEVER